MLFLKGLNKTGTVRNMRDMWRVSENEKCVTLLVSISQRKTPVRKPTSYGKKNNITVYHG
jgi:hypothetical protein